MWRFLTDRCLIFHWQVVTESLKHCWICLFFFFFFLPAACRNRHLCSILMKPTWIWTADRDIECFILCFVFDHGLLMSGMGHKSIIQVESFLIFHSGSFLKGNKARVTYQPELLWESLFKKLLIPEGLCRGFRCDSLLMKELTNSAQHTKNTLTAHALYTTSMGTFVWVSCCCMFGTITEPPLLGVVTSKPYYYRLPTSAKVTRLQ